MDAMGEFVGRMLRTASSKIRADSSRPRRPTGSVERRHAAGDRWAVYGNQRGHRRVCAGRDEVERRGRCRGAGVHGAAPGPLAGIRVRVRGSAGRGHVALGFVSLPEGRSARNQASSDWWPDGLRLYSLHCDMKNSESTGRAGRRVLRRAEPNGFLGLSDSAEASVSLDSSKGRRLWRSVCGLSAGPSRSLCWA